MAEIFKLMAEYTLALLQLLVSEGPMTTRAALETFEKRYHDRIPKDMYGMTGNEVKWSNRVRWERLNLARLEFMGNDKKGIWYATEKGRQFLQENPDEPLNQLQDLISLDAIRMKEKRQKKVKEPSTKTTKPSGIKQKKKPKTPRQRSGNQQRLLTTPQIDPTNTNAYRILNQEIQTIRDYLRGVSSLQPSNELLCDWVNFCYTFELYAEGIELYTLVTLEGVNSWYYKRIRKMARLCAMKVKEKQP